MVKRQKIRKTIILMSFLLFPITLYYFSPYLIVMGASEGILSGSAIIFSLMFIFSLVFGRGFCGWLCPAGGLQECCSMVVDKKANGGVLNWIKFFIWVPWIASIITMFLLAGGIKRTDFFYQTQYGISTISIQAYVVYYGVVALVTILALTLGRRSFCHYVCWMAPFMIIGTKIKNIFKYPSLHLDGEKDKCISCSICNKKCPMSLDVNSMVKKEKMHNLECILCGECVDSCPKKAIKITFSTDK